jgi:hypothetical protein
MQDIDLATQTMFAELLQRRSLDASALGTELTLWIAGPT